MDYWNIFKPKFAIWENFGGSCNGGCWNILRPFDLFYFHLEYLMVIWNISSRFGMLYLEKSGNPDYICTYINGFLQDKN
jgi:hypothetical protein